MFVPCLCFTVRRNFHCECNSFSFVVLRAQPHSVRHITRYNAEFAVTLLKAPPRGHAYSPAIERDVPLALCVLYARMGNEDTAAAQIAERLDDVQVSSQERMHG